VFLAISSKARRNRPHRAKCCSLKVWRKQRAQAWKPKRGEIRQQRRRTRPLPATLRRREEAHAYRQPRARWLKENGLSAPDINRHGQRRLASTKEDVNDGGRGEKRPAKPAAGHSRAPAQAVRALGEGDRVEKRVPMTRPGARIAERLVDAPSPSMAMLTTFNEVDMKPIMDLRKEVGSFEKKHKRAPGLSCRSSSRRLPRSAEAPYPAVNASIDGSDVVYHGYQDSVWPCPQAIRGLVVPDRCRKH